MFRFLSALFFLVVFNGVAHAQFTVGVDGGSVSISNGNISGSWSDVNPSFPEEVDNGSVSGTITPTGQISGSFSGTDTYYSSGGGLVSEPYSGSFSGTINPDTGAYSVSWGGSEPGSRSGVAPTSIVPSAPEPDDEQDDPPPDETDDTEVARQRDEDDNSIDDQALEIGDFSLEEIQDLLREVSGDPTLCLGG